MSRIRGVRRGVTTSTMTWGLAVFLIAGCASFQPRTEGMAGPVAWKTTDLQPAGDQYAFTLVLTDTRGVGITYTEVRAEVSQAGGGASLPSVSQGHWRMLPHGEIRMSFRGRSWCHGCMTAAPGLWYFVFTGTDDRDEAVRLEFEARLPVTR